MINNHGGIWSFLDLDHIYSFIVLIKYHEEDRYYQKTIDVLKICIVLLAAVLDIVDVGLGQAGGGDAGPGQGQLGDVPGQPPVPGPGRGRRPPQPDKVHLG